MSRLDEIAADLTRAQQDIPNGDVTTEPGRSILAARLRLQREHAPVLLDFAQEVAKLARQADTWEGLRAAEADALQSLCNELVESKERNHEV